MNNFQQLPGETLKFSRKLISEPNFPAIFSLHKAILPWITITASEWETIQIISYYPVHSFFRGNLRINFVDFLPFIWESFSPRYVEISIRLEGSTFAQTKNHFISSEASSRCKSFKALLKQQWVCLQPWYIALAYEWNYIWRWRWIIYVRMEIGEASKAFSDVPAPAMIVPTCFQLLIPFFSTPTRRSLKIPTRSPCYGIICRLRPTSSRIMFIRLTVGWTIYKRYLGISRPCKAAFRNHAKLIDFYKSVLQHRCSD